MCVGGGDGDGDAGEGNSVGSLGSVKFAQWGYLQMRRLAYMLLSPTQPQEESYHVGAASYLIKILGAVLLEIPPHCHCYSRAMHLLPPKSYSTGFGEYTNTKTQPHLSLAVNLSCDVLGTMRLR